LPPELQQRVHHEVEITHKRSRWPVKKTLAALGVSPRSYYRWLKTQLGSKPASTESAPAVVPPYDALPEEKKAVIDYARKNTHLRHREMAWKMVDQGVAFLSPSTVYRTLKESNLVCPWQRRQKRTRQVTERATAPDQRWSTDLMYLQVGGHTYYFLAFLDEYSRAIVHHEILLGMDSISVSNEAQKAIEQLPKNEDGSLKQRPVIRSDNGSCYISQEFRLVLKENGLTHHRITPHCPEENGLMERANRTLRESLECEPLENLVEARKVMNRHVKRYNHERLHSALGYLPPWEYYRGDPAKRQDERRVKLQKARHERRERNLKLRQPTLPLEATESFT
jgi:putative transposase